VVGRLSGVRPGRVVAFGVDHESLGTQRLVVLAEVDPDQISLAEPPQAGDQRGLMARDSALLALRTTITKALFELLAIGVPDVILLAPGALRKSSSGKLSRQVMRSLYLENALEPLAGLADRH
jgi:acyl-CoA synthetase (AMP-forming)/AMP-acid ligase II